MDPDEPRSDDAVIRPPHSGPIRHKIGARPTPYSPKPPIRQPYQQQSPP